MVDYFLLSELLVILVRNDISLGIGDEISLELLLSVSLVPILVVTDWLAVEEEWLTFTHKVVEV